MRYLWVKCCRLFYLIFFGENMNKVLLLLRYGDYFFMERKGKELYFPYVETEAEITDYKENKEKWKILNKEIKNWFIKKFGIGFDVEAGKTCNKNYGFCFIDIEEAYDNDESVDSNIILEKLKDLKLVNMDVGLDGGFDKLGTGLLEDKDERIALNKDNYIAFKEAYEMNYSDYPPFYFQHLTPVFDEVYKDQNKK